jgi:N-acetylmuramoyl-L-alanine amidase
MFKTFRVAGFAAAAFLCAANSTAAVAEDKIKIVPTAHEASVTPVLPAVTETPQINAEPAVITLPVRPDDSGTPAAGPTRPDRFTTEAPAAAPTPAPGLGVSGVASVRRPLADLVAEHARADTSDEEFECLARAVYFESRGEPLEGQLAVAEVILNRVRSGRFRSTICDVVRQPSQFSFVRRGVIPEAPRESAAWHRSVAIAHIALNDLADATGDESLFFHATYVNPRWGRPRIARIGNHIFYR